MDGWMRIDEGVNVNVKVCESENGERKEEWKRRRCESM